MSRKLNSAQIIVIGVVVIVAAISFAASDLDKPQTKVEAAVITTTTTAPTTTTASTIPPPPAGLGIGATGQQVTQLQQTLQRLHYDLSVSGVYDTPTYYSVMAFQKVAGLKRSGRATNDVFAALNTASDPAPLIAKGEGNRIEVDIPHQVLFFYTGGKLNRILPVSTGGGYKYCVAGECAYAVTPGGRFRVYKKIPGKHTSKLGHMWNSLFFNAGLAIHGEPSDPAYPASHGCVRIPMYSSVWFYSAVSTGTPVYIVGGPAHVPPPFQDDSELAPGQTLPPDNQSTTTSLESTTTTDLSTTITTAQTTTTF